MDKFTDELAALQQFLNRLTWKKILQMVAIFLVIAVAWVLTQTSDQIADYLKKGKKEHIEDSKPALKSVSKETQDQIDKLVGKSDLVEGVAITVVDFQTNSRFVIYIKSYDKGLNNVYQEYDLLNYGHPLFSQNKDQNQTDVSLLNGEFICVPYNTTLLSGEMPDTIKYITTSCAVGIPPYYGRFVGIVEVFVKKQPTQIETDQLRVIARAISTTVYEKDLNK